MSAAVMTRQDDNFEPITEEQDLVDLPITGELPRGLAGTLFRNGPNPQFAPVDPAQQHWFAGDGMLHAFTLRNGRAAYRNRWVRTEKWQAEHAAGRALMSGGLGGPQPPGAVLRDIGVANTNVIWHGGRLLALEEAHQPIEVDPVTLATRGVPDLGRLQGPFTAHPKEDPVTGELVFFGYSARGPFSPAMSWGTLDAAGRVTRFEYFDAPYAAMVHDFAVTARHVVFPILPLVGRLERARARQNPYAWEPELGGQVGVMTRAGGVASLRWFRVEDGYVYHVLNAWEEGSRILVDVMQYAAPPLFPRADGGTSTRDQTRARLVRWTIDLAGGTEMIRREQLDDLTGEFPRIDDRRAGLANRYGAFVGRTAAETTFDTLAWLDLKAGKRSTFLLPEGDALSEAVFVPRGPQAPEGDGWLLTVAWRGAEQRSDLLVLEAADISRGPVATVRLPHRVPFGFHGNWVGAGAIGATGVIGGAH